MSRCCWCGREATDLVERPNADDHGPIGRWCADWKACQARRESVRTVSRLGISRR